MPFSSASADGRYPVESETIATGTQRFYQFRSADVPIAGPVHAPLQSANSELAALRQCPGPAEKGIDGGSMVTLTDKATTKVKELMNGQAAEAESGLRVAIRGGGCSGFQYALAF